MSVIAKTIQRVCAAAGVNVTRLPRNRFDAMPEVLHRLARERFEPTRIIDVGANVGQWATMVSAAYPRVPLHLIEPQPHCRPALDAFALRRGATEIHGVVVTRPGMATVRMWDADAGSSGARVIRDTGAPVYGEVVAATTVDELLGGRIRDTESILFKLDVEGHELDVLEGAQQLLTRVDVIIIETQFYEIEGNGDTTFLELCNAMAPLEFVLYDVAGLASRRRDGRLRMGDVVFVRRTSALAADDRWA
jgi:FkbM family methyltransferase